jgi:hypothetical protein
MGSILDLIKKIVGGLFSFIGGILGGNKSGFYMEAEELPASKSAAPKQEAPATLIAEAPKAEAPKAEAPKAPKPAAAPVQNGAAPVAAPSNNGSAPAPQPAAASDLIMLSTPRRRPGANMSSFLEMAKTVKTPQG